MGELTKYLEQQKAAKAKAQEDARVADRSRTVTAPSRTPLMERRIDKCYAPGVCSKNGADLLFVCELFEGIWVADRAILRDVMRQQPKPPADKTYGATEIEFHLQPGWTCPSCHVHVKGEVLIRGARYKIDAFVCPECLLTNCLGFQKVVDGQLWVKCGKCGGDGPLGKDPYEGKTEALTEAPRRPASSTPPPAASGGFSLSASPAKRLK